MKQISIRVAVLALLCAAAAAPASAQIYSWRDGTGNLVLSNVRPARSVRTYAVPDTRSVRATRSASPARSSLYEDLIRQHAQLNGVRTDLVRAVVQVESGFNPRARSPKGALGLMQLMPATIREFNVRNPFDPGDNVRAGVAYLRQLLDRYNNNEQLALAAYNAGPGAVDSHGETVPPYRETKEYVYRINRMAGRPIEMRHNRIYRVTEIVDGRTVVRYTDQKPTSGEYELVRPGAWGK
ncbi:MAG: lytic transglycosylase domain-containing protein [Betaproteobacteria bacterium]